MSSLLPIFRDKLIPWAQQDLTQRLAVARPVMKKALLPDSVQLARKKIPGKRVNIRNRRDYANQRIYRARWPEAGLHELDVPKLVCVTKGVTDYQAGEYIISCGEGHFILLPPLTPNTTGGRSHLEGENRKHGSCELVQFLLFRDSIQCISCSSRGEEHYDDAAGYGLIHHFQAVRLFNLFMEEAVREHSNGEICGHLLSTFFLYLLREMESGNPLQRVRTMSSNFPTDNPLQEVRDYIKSHLRQHLTIETMAHQMHMSPSQFTRYVRKNTGQSFVEILTECRLEEAKALLIETRWAIRAIADAVGFKSPTYFNALFHRQVGCSPGTYRENPQFDKVKK